MIVCIENKICKLNWWNLNKNSGKHFKKFTNLSKNFPQIFSIIFRIQVKNITDNFSFCSLNVAQIVAFNHYCYYFFLQVIPLSLGINLCIYRVFPSPVYKLWREAEKNHNEAKIIVKNHNCKGKQRLKHNSNWIKWHKDSNTTT